MQAAVENRSSIIVELSFSSWDPVELEQNETLQLLGLQEMWTDVQVCAHAHVISASAWQRTKCCSCYIYTSERKTHPPGSCVFLTLD